mgnify:FL=1
MLRPVVASLNKRPTFLNETGRFSRIQQSSEHPLKSLSYRPTISSLCDEDGIDLVQDFRNGSNRCSKYGRAAGECFDHHQSKSFKLEARHYDEIRSLIVIVEL